MGCCISVKISRIGSFQSVPDFSNSMSKAHSESKILILGTSNSGKSTLYRQMQIINTAGFSQDEKKSYKKILTDNIIDCISTLLDCMECNPIEAEIDGLITEFRHLASGERWNLSGCEETKLLKLSRQLWELPLVKACFKEHSSKLECPESIAVLLEDLDGIAKDGSLPTHKQILHCRLKTTGVRALNFVHDNNFVQVIDVGGQRSERRKWMHYFDDVEVLLFCVAIDEYDMVLREDLATRAMDESVEVFKSVINSLWFRSKTIVVFLNKVDLLEKKVATSNLQSYYEDFKGDPRVTADVVEFIKRKYLRCNEHKNRKIFTFTTCATDTENISRVSRICFDSVLNKHLAMTGLE